MSMKGISSTVVVVFVLVVVVVVLVVLLLVVLDVVIFFRTLFEVVPPNKSQELAHKTEGNIFHQHLYTPSV